MQWCKSQCSDLQWFLFNFQIACWPNVSGHTNTTTIAAPGIMQGNLNEGHKNLTFYANWGFFVGFCWRVEAMELAKKLPAEPPMPPLASNECVQNGTGCAAPPPIEQVSG